MSDPTLQEIIEEALREKGYSQFPKDPDYWFFDEEWNTPDKLIPTIIDCLRRES